MTESDTKLHARARILPWIEDEAEAAEWASRADTSYLVIIIASAVHPPRDDAGVRARVQRDAAVVELDRRIPNNQEVERLRARLSEEEKARGSDAEIGLAERARADNATAALLAAQAEVKRLTEESSRLHQTALDHQRWREKAEEQARKASAETETYRKRLELWTSPLPSDQIRVAEERGVTAGIAWEMEVSPETVRVLYPSKVAFVLIRLRGGPATHAGDPIPADPVPCAPLPESVTLDPGIREVVLALRNAGFDTTDSGDGTSKPPSERAFDQPHVFIRVNPGLLVSEAHRLLSVAPYLPNYQRSVEASYDPSNKIGVLALMYRDDTPF